MTYLENSGHCVICDDEVTFKSEHSWLRDHYLCSSCGSIPRERALMRIIQEYYPGWRDMVIHESSPLARGASVRMGTECSRYVPSQFYHDLLLGTMSESGVRCENLEQLTFDDCSIDLHVTQDVMEHVFSPSAVFSEIARTLKPGGAHIFTVPLVNKARPSSRRAILLSNGEIQHLCPPIYHGNPISDSGALVTVDWGYDIASHILETCGLSTHIHHIDDLSQGIRAEFIEVLVTQKPSPAVLDATVCNSASGRVTS